MSPYIDKIYASKEVEAPSGRNIPLHSSIDRDEGAFISNLIRNDSSIRKTLEVGCAYGLSSLFIAEGLKGRSDVHHTIVDPFQSTHWEGVGVHNLKKSGFGEFTLLEQKSEFALPSLLKTAEAGFDFAFIDGFHTFDHTLIDCFYATRLLRVGGMLVVDDVGYPAIRKVMDYLLQYPCFTFAGATTRQNKASLKKRLAQASVGMIPGGLRKQIISKTFLNRLSNEQQGMVALRKTAKDERSWDWFQGDF